MLVDSDCIINVRENVIIYDLIVLMYAAKYYLLNITVILIVWDSEAVIIIMIIPG